MVFLKCIDTLAGAVTGLAAFMIPRVCITVLIGKRPTTDCGLLAISQGNEDTSRTRRIIVRESFNELFTNT